MQYLAALEALRGRQAELAGPHTHRMQSAQAAATRLEIGSTPIGVFCSLCLIFADRCLNSRHSHLRPRKLADGPFGVSHCLSMRSMEAPLHGYRTHRRY